MIIGIEGGLGSGKTILAIRYLVKDSLKKYKLYSNCDLKKIKYNQLNVLEILKMQQQNLQLNNVSVFIDEITVFMDCRTSLSKANRIFSYFVLQTRKRNVTLYYTTQDITMVDKRLERHTDIRIVAEKIFKYVTNHITGEIKKIPIEGKRLYTIYDLRDVRDIKIIRIIVDISKYYNYYDTNQVILPPIL